MDASLAPYIATVHALGATATLSLVQLLVADGAGVAAGHVPGTPVEAKHESFLFRATRAHANTNETMGVFVLVCLFGILGGADPTWLGRLSWVYVAGRAAHMLLYYADLRPLRSVAFVVSLLALVGMLVVGFATT